MSPVCICLCSDVCKTNKDHVVVALPVGVSELEALDAEGRHENWAVDGKVIRQLTVEAHGHALSRSFLAAGRSTRDHVTATIESTLSASQGSSFFFKRHRKVNFGLNK